MSSRFDSRLDGRAAKRSCCAARPAGANYRAPLKAGRWREDPDDRVAILEFATVVDGKQVEGIDKLTFDDDGKITEFKVMIRPASALQLVGAKMAEEFPKVGLHLPS